MTFKEYALALGGALQALAGIWKLREVFRGRIGPPNGPVAARVSTTRQGGRGLNSSAPERPGTLKYPLISKTTSVLFDAKTLAAALPPPACTIAAFAITSPKGAFKVEIPGGCGVVAGHSARYANGCAGTTVTLSD